MKNYRFSWRRSERQQGFTLVELLVTMAILVILVAIGAPELQGLLVKRAVATQADTLASGLRLARSEAIKRGQRVTICASAAPEAPTPSCLPSGDTDWATGWIIFVDKPGALKSFDDGDQVLKVQQAFSNSGGIESKDKSAITFAQNGMAVSDDTTFQIKPHISGSRAQLPDFNRCIKLSVSGRSNVQAPDSKGAC